VKTLAILMMVALAAGAGWADTLRLKDGAKHEGVLLEADTKRIRFQLEDGEEREYETGQVAGVDFAPLIRRKVNPAGAGEVIPAGTQIAVRMVSAIDGKSARGGARFEASLDDGVMVGSLLAFAKGSECVVEVVEVKQGQEMALRLVAVKHDGKTYGLSTETAEVGASGSSKASKSVKRGIGLGALGAGIGAIAGGGKGAAIGAAIGGGAGAASGAAARGKQLNIAPETRLIFTLTAPVPLN
jgi:hypothetical protein